MTYENETDPTEDPLYSTRKVAAMFHVATETVRNWIKVGKLQGTQVGNRWHVRRSEVIRFANTRHGDDGGL